MVLLLYKTYLLLFVHVDRDNTGQLLEMWVVRVKIWVCYGCYYTEQRSNEQWTRDRLTGKNSRGQKFSNLLKICRIDYNGFFLALICRKELQNQFRNQAWRPISSKLKLSGREVFLKHYIPGSLKLFYNFHGKLISTVILKTVDIYLEMSTWSSNLNHNFGFVVEEIFELGHIRKSRCFDSDSVVNSHR